MERRVLLRAAGAAVASGVVGVPFLAALAREALPVALGPYGALQRPDREGVQLPAGFTSRVIARSGQRVAGTSYRWHFAPDGGATFAMPDGGWVYVSNSERWSRRGGVGAIRFDSRGVIVDAYPILSNTTQNCSGGATPVGTWLSCEEHARGRVYECDPTGVNAARMLPGLGTFTHEAAAVDPVTGAVYLTEDLPNGRLYRFVPDRPGDLNVGVLFAASFRPEEGRVRWRETSADRPDRSRATTAFNGGEGIYIAGRNLWFTTKGDRKVWHLHLETSALSLYFDAANRPQRTLNAVDNIVVHPMTGEVYVGEDGGNMELCLLSARASDRASGDRASGHDRVEATPFLRWLGHWSSEVAGPAFSPDGSRLYLSSQRGSDGRNGVTIEVTGPFEP